MKQDLYGTRLYINYSHLKHNFNYLKSIAPDFKIIAMVKANAYGHGDIHIAEKMESFNIDYFGVADFEEGLRLRNNRIKTPIIVMNPGINNIPIIIENDLEPVIYNYPIFSKVVKYTKMYFNEKSIDNNQKKIPVHIKINTGMNRWGFDLSEIPTLIKELKNNKSIIIGSIYSHLASAENSKHDVFTKNQIHQLVEIREIFQKQFDYSINTHILNSSGLLRGIGIDKLNYLRTGILLYGAENHQFLKPIGELKCPVSQIRTINIGDSIGYERKYIAKNKLKIGIIPFGYADGLQRSWGNGVLKFYYNNQLLPTIGNISMDSCAVDLSTANNISVGDDVLYFGEKRPIWELSQELNTIPYEIISTLSRRIKRIYYE